MALFGRAMLTLHLPGHRPLPPLRLSAGAMVALRSAHAPATAAKVATLTAVRELSLSVTLDEHPEDDELSEPLTLCMLHNDVSYRRCQQALDAVRQGSAPAAARALREALLGEAPLAPAPALPLPETALFNTKLNAGQRDAVAFALAARPVACIHGPPGTGKTTAVVELVRQAVARGERVLASAASNVAVDNMAERLLAGAKPPRLVRIGHPARMLPSVLDAALDARLARADQSGLASDVRTELDAAQKKLRGERAKGARGALRAEVGALRKELASRQQRAVVEVLEQAQVVLCTNSGAQDRALRALPEDHTEMPYVSLPRRPRIEPPHPHRAAGRT